MKPKKLIRSGITKKLKEGEWETITDKNELNRLYAIKIREELAEIQASDHKDIFEFADLIQVVFSFAKQNGFTHEGLSEALTLKAFEKGVFGRVALNNLNPDNPSNKLYFEDNNEPTDDWINVNDECPELMQEVLVYGKGNYEYPHCRIAVYLGNKYFSTSGIQSGFNATHWQAITNPTNGA